MKDENERDYEVIWLFPEKIRAIITGVSLFILTMLLLFFVVVFTQWG